ncbi:IclR family transcriptional regulator [Ornithinimicrobium pratense]|uniref:Helix-turn-helix domain-containing protein n=1 Tax=Ornithinimicrobium pratense TaxID=2593973 RepID=A0A5J6V4Z1_9MICO|nr:helix-turn-helix domain-containing protein [Ornithinimicrobium pratense]QFG69019.1 helix-turn-helix domain-containing protein [Ornithinimicrobium pratense]
MTSPAETSQTLDRGLQVLQLLGSPGGSAGMTVSALAQELGVGRAIIYRLVATLQARDFVTRGEDGRVRLGLGVTRLQLSVRPMLVELARPLLRELADQVGATAHLTVAEGEQALALVVVEPSWTDFHVSYRVGSRHPLDRGAAGRAILAGRRSGDSRPVATTGELQPGAHGVAAWVPDVPGLEASVGVVTMGPPPPVQDEVVATARWLTRSLTGQAP